MKSIFLIIFLSLGYTAFSANTSIESDIIRTLTNDNSTIKIDNRISNVKDNSLIAFDFYYTVDWLYSETPFSYKLEAYV